MLRTLSVSSVLLAAAAQAQPVYTTILTEGDPVPGWTDQTVGWTSGDPFLFNIVTPDGDVIFRTQHAESNSQHHLHRYDASARAVLVHAAAGAPVLGLAADLTSPSRADSAPNGATLFAGTAQLDSGAQVSGLFVLGDEGPQVIAHNRDSVPVHGVPFRGFNSNPFIEVDANGRGDAVVKARFQLEGNDHDGVYRAALGEPMSRIIDTTLPVPGHPDRQWSRATNWLAPFEPRNVVLTEAGDAYFRAWITGDAEPEMMLFRSRPDGTLETVVDSLARTPIPGRADNAPLLGIVSVNGSGGQSVLLSASSRGSGYTGSSAGGTDVLLAKGDQPLTSLWASTHAQIPGRPELRVEVWGGQDGLAVNTHDRAVVSSFVHYDNGDFGRMLVSVDPTGDNLLVAEGNDLPDQRPGTSARYFASADINEHGDIAFFANIRDSEGGSAVFHWSHDDRELTRLLQRGMEVNGRTVLDFSLSMTSSAGGASNRFLSENNVVSASILFAANGFDDEEWSLVRIQVPSPAPLSLTAAACALAAVRRRR